MHSPAENYGYLALRHTVLDGPAFYQLWPMEFIYLFLCLRFKRAPARPASYGSWIRV